MSGLLRSQQSQAQQITTYSGLQVQETSSCVPVPIAYGCNMFTPNAIWYNNFQQHNASGGKGGGKGGAFSSGGGTQSYTYSCAIIMALCEGPIGGIGQIWQNSSTTSIGLGDIGLSLAPGTMTQGVWGYLNSAYPAQALAYPGIAYVYGSGYDLGSSASVGSTNFEVQGVLYSTGFNGIDADPAKVIEDFLTNTQYGVGFPSASIDLSLLIGGSGTSTYQAYCWATGLAISPVLNATETASQTLARWLQLTNSAAVWSSGQLKIIPYGDLAVTGNGQTFAPDVTPLYDLTDEDFVYDSGTDPIQISRVNPYATPNNQAIEIMARNDYYNTGPVTAFDQGHIQQFGLRVGSTITAHEICDLGIAQTAVQLILQRGLYVQKTYQFKLSWEFCLLEPMDLVTLTDPLLGLNKTVVRLTDIEEADDGLLTVTAEEFPQGVATATEYATQAVINYFPNANVAVAAVNTPLIIEPPPSLTAGVAQLWLGACSSDANWGGCNIYASLDNASYAQIGSITGASRQGVTTAAFAAFTGANPDATNTFAVSMAESLSSLASVSGTSAAAGATLCYVDGEYLAFENATLTGAHTYTITGLYRGLYNSTASAHASGVNFCMLDSGVLKYDLPSADAGQVVYLKFQSFNIFGGGVEDLSTCTAYTYTARLPGVIQNLTGVMTQAGLSNTLNASWSLDPFSMDYQAEISADNGTTWTTIYQGPLKLLSETGLAQVALLCQVRGISATGIYGTWTQITIQPATITANASHLTQVIGFAQLQPIILDATLNADAQADQNELASFANSVTQSGQTQASQKSANAAAAAVIQQSNIILPAITANFAAQTTGLTQQIASINASVLANAAQEIADVTELNGLITTLTETVETSTAFTSGISIAQAGINTATSITADSNAAASNLNEDSGELTSFVTAVQTGLAATIAVNASNAALSAVTVQTISNTTATSAVALQQTTLAAAIAGNLATINQVSTVQATQFSAIAGTSDNLTVGYGGEDDTGELAAFAAAVQSGVINTTTLKGINAASAAALSTTQSLIANASESFGQLTTTLAATFAGNIAVVTTQIAAQATTLSATAASLSSLQSQVGDTTTGLSATYGLSVTTSTTVNSGTIGNIALSSAVSTLTSQVGDGTTGLSATYSMANTTAAVVNSGTIGNSVLASSVSTLSSQINNGSTGLSATYSIATAVQGTVDSGSIGNVALSSQITTLTSNVGANTASISTLQGTVSSLNSEYASITTSLSAVSSQASGASASGQISFVAQAAPSGATASFGLTLSIAGYAAVTGGYSIVLQGSTVQTIFQTNSFQIQNGTTKAVPFAIDSSGNVYLQNTTYISSVIKSTALAGANPVMQIDFVNGAISIYDAS